MHVVIAGTGSSPRNNTEALVEDYLSTRPESTLVIPAFRGVLTPTQVHAAQLLVDKGKKVLTILREDASCEEVVEGAESVYIKDTDDMVKAALKYLDGQSEGLFIAWNDDDPLSTALLQAAAKSGITAQDLTNGLLTIPPAENLVKEDDVNISESEKVIEEDDDEDDEDSTEEEAPFWDLSPTKLEEIAEVFAKAIAKELRDLLK